MNSKAVLISGGTSGIGLATAEILLRRGWRVAVNGRDIVRGEAALAYLCRTGCVVNLVCLHINW